MTQNRQGWSRSTAAEPIRLSAPRDDLDDFDFAPLPGGDGSAERPMVVGNIPPAA